MLIKGFDECSICFEKIKNPSNGYKPMFSLGFVCENCNNNFTPKEKETIIHAFNVARGIFNVDEKDNMIVKDVLYDVYSELELQNKRFFTTESIFQKILIRSQLYCLSLNSFFYSKYLYSKNISKNSNCTICNNPLDAKLKSNVLTIKNERVCHNCVQKFQKEEILAMIPLFIKYGGFFNTLISHKQPLRKIVENLLNSIAKEKDFSRMIELNEKALYRALLFGYRPKKFIEELKKF